MAKSKEVEAFVTDAEVVIIGGGIIGASSAYHLAKTGCKNVVLIERNKIASGTTWHSAAQVRQIRSSKNLTRMIQYSTQLYASLEAETGLPTGWSQCGSISIATSKERLTHIRRQASLARAFDIEIHEIDASEVNRHWPLAYTDDMISAVYSPTDGRVEPKLTAHALIAGARAMGVKVYEHTKATGIKTQNNHVAAVKTSRGTINCEKVVDCAGAWGRQVADMAGIGAPLYSCEHLYVITEPIDEITSPLPIMSDHDGWLYMRDHEGGLLIGCFEPKAKAFNIDTLPDTFAFDTFPWDHEHFAPIYKNMKHRIPRLKTAEIRTYLNGPESFTPDDNLLLGESAELKGFFYACGLNSVGVATGGGVGRALAEWVTTGTTELDLWPLDVKRFGNFHTNERALRERIPETMALHYAISYPHREHKTTRNLRLSPIHHQLRDDGAEFGARMGWERANWFQPKDTRITNELTFGQPNWFEQVRKEHLAARENVALFDQSSFSKLLLQGRDCESFLQRVCANNLEVNAGQIVYTGMLNERGGYESDITIQRLSNDSFMIITGTNNAVRDSHWLKSKLDPGEFVTITDMSGAEAVLSLMGPNSREILKEISPDDFANEAFPFYTHKEIEIGYVRARAARLSYVGELGWELYIPAENAVNVYNAIHEAGEAYGLINSGMFALSSLRVEKAFRAWGHELTPEDTPFEAGLSFAVDLNKRNFIGKDALLNQQEQGVNRRLVTLCLDKEHVYPMGNEPIYSDGQLIGRTTSGAYGYSFNKALMLGYVNLENHTLKDLSQSDKLEIEYASRRYPVTLSRSAAYDPKGARMKA